jgi:hypothetical protein
MSYWVPSEKWMKAYLMGGIPERKWLTDQIEAGKIRPGSLSAADINVGQIWVNKINHGQVSLNLPWWKRLTYACEVLFKARLTLPQ